MAEPMGRADGRQDERCCGREKRRASQAAAAHRRATTIVAAGCDVIARGGCGIIWPGYLPFDLSGWLGRATPQGSYFSFGSGMRSSAAL